LSRLINKNLFHQVEALIMYLTLENKKAPDASKEPPSSISSASAVLHSGKTSAYR